MAEKKDIYLDVLPCATQIVLSQEKRSEGTTKSNSQLLEEVEKIKTITDILAKWLINKFNSSLKSK